MVTKRLITSDGLIHSMGNDKSDLKNKPITSLDYIRFLERTKIGNPSFDTYIESLSEEMQIYDAIDPYKKDALKEITDKADSFLIRHAGISYDNFLRQSKSEEFIESDYGNLPEKRNLKRRLFEHRAMFYLSALQDTERKGYDISELLTKIEEGIIPYLKKERNEPTFQEILRVLRK